ncbi:MAG: thioredoxin domain-containing protein [Candidatus Acidiferrales bacterium]
MRSGSYALLALAILMAGPLAFAQTATPASAQAVPADEVQFLKNAEPFVRKLFAWGPEFQVKLGPTSPSSAPDYYLVPVQITVNGQTDNGVLYISKDGKTLLRGELFDTSSDPFAANRAHLHIEGNPSKGPADARVTLVEFSDFECPHCRQLYEAMKILGPHYPQIRIVFKDLPIAAIHPWAMTAAIGGRCAYKQSPDAFWAIHDGLFENQEFISAADIWEKLLDLAGQAGLDKDAFKACLASPEAQKAVEANIADALAMSVNSTPTVFVNGRPVVGGDPSTLQQYIDYELGGTQPAQTKSHPPLPGKPAQKQPIKPPSK